MRSVLISLLAASVVLTTPRGVTAAPGSSASRDEERSEQEEVDAAIEAWARGDWSQVRARLEPLVQGGRDLEDPLLTETALRYLADATLQDSALGADLRDQLASSYIDRLLDADPDWRPPEATHGPEFYALVNDKRDKRERARLDLCEAQSVGCQADLEDLTVRYNKLDEKYRELNGKFDKQEVEVREIVARNRAIALVPFGVGHFYNGNTALGATFLATEAAVGATGLALLITRIQGCEPVDNPDAQETIRCDTSASGKSQDAWVLHRNAETFFGFAFISLLVIDIVVAQILFDPLRVESTRRVTREQLEREASKTDAEAGPKRPRRNRKQARATLRPQPVPTLLRGGAGFGVSLRF
ncbi:MAG: hypothetical protein H6713_31100 [Myxococcales bacterium]|nr:hypothetical protein [Myxococcales bacterium]MCB9754411.1 hypothetical protein [Myxococcales bacterium]